MNKTKEGFKKYTIYLSKSLAEQVEKYLAKEGISFSEYIENLIKEDLARKEKLIKKPRE